MERARATWGALAWIAAVGCSRAEPDLGRGPQLANQESPTIADPSREGAAADRHRAGATASSDSTGEARAGRQQAPAGFAVAELFTSEGCSSCPPADVNLAHIARAYADDRVLSLSFHVDYWNDLGFVDPYSDAAFSERQRRYARALGGGVYTPQLVINGTHELIGSHRDRSRELIDAALGRAPTATLSLATTVTDSTIRVRYDARGELAPHWVTVALLKREAKTHVPRGENRGRTLEHVNVVRKLVSVESEGAGSGTITVPLPGGLAPNDRQIVGFVQERASLAIVAAARPG